MLLRRIALCLALSCSAPLAAAAAPAAAAATRVGRVSFISGHVSVQPAGLDTWTPAAINRVISNGDHVFAAPNARAELHMGRLVVRLDGDTALEVQELTAHGARIALLQGRANINLLGDDAAQSLYEIDMPTAATKLDANGVYTVRAAADGSTSSVTVRRGSAEMFVGGVATQVTAESCAQAQDRQAPQLRASEAPDSFDAWSSDRQRHDDAAVALRYVRPEVVGYEDLDTYGSWRQSKDYGPLWQPQDTPAGWAPYHDGQWSYTRAWGWTWNDAAPWGFAPSHYGRWVYQDDAWAWAPGADAAAGDTDDDLVYAPATVAFLQMQAADAAAAAFVEGAVVGELLGAWVPLAPGEPLMVSYGGYYPGPYRPAPTNVVGVAQVAAGRPAYANRPGAVVLAGPGAFRNAMPIHYHRNVAPETVAQLRPVSAAQVAHPTVASVVAAPAHLAARVARPPAAALDRIVVAHAPAPAPPARLVAQPLLHPLPVRGNRNNDDPVLPPSRVPHPVPVSAAGGGRVAPTPSHVWSETVPLHGERPVPGAHAPSSAVRPLPHPAAGWSPHRSVAAPAVAPLAGPAPVAPVAPNAQFARPMAPVVRPFAVPASPAQPASAPHPAAAAVVHPAPMPVVHPAPMPMLHPAPVMHPAPAMHPVPVMHPR